MKQKPARRGSPSYTSTPDADLGVAEMGYSVLLVSNTIPRKTIFSESRELFQQNNIILSVQKMWVKQPNSYQRKCLSPLSIEELTVRQLHLCLCPQRSCKQAGLCVISVPFGDIPWLSIHLSSYFNSIPPFSPPSPSLLHFLLPPLPFPSSLLPSLPFLFFFPEKHDFEITKTVNVEISL